MIVPRAISPQPRARAWPLLLLVACATREVPARYPERSPASEQAAPAPALHVEEALAGDPPLPGSAQPGWRGLTEGRDAGGGDASAPRTHPAHGGHHHGH